MMKFPVNLHYGGTSHCTLKYAGMKNRPVSDEDLVRMFPHKFSGKWYARRAMETLTKYGYAETVGDKIQITKLGVLYLSKVAKQYVGEFK